MLILLQFLNHFQEAIIPYFLLKYARKVKATHANALFLFSVLMLIENFCSPHLKLRRLFILLIVECFTFYTTSIAHTSMEILLLHEK